MKRESTGPILTTVFVDYDNIYLSLKRKSDDAAKRFAKDSGLWLSQILSGDLITPTSQFAPAGERRIVMNRCYGNPVPRRNSNDNSTDMNSFPFIRHHFLKSGFEVIDCPPLTAQLKNSADIRIVMDIRDILSHATYFDEFVIMSGDADFTPLLHRLRAHARRTVVYANDHTAAPYTAISDGEIRENSLIGLLLSGQTQAQITSSSEAKAELAPPAPPIDVEAARRATIAEVVSFVRSAPQAVPLETLADRAVRILGHEKTVGTQWGGFGSFRDLLLAGLPDDIHLSDTPPYTVFDANRHISSTGLIAPQLPPPQAEARAEMPRMEMPVSQASAVRPAFQPLTEPRFVQAPMAPPASAPPPPQQPVRRATEPNLPPMSSRAVDSAFSGRLAPQSSAAPQAPAKQPGRASAAPSQPAASPAVAQPRTADQATQIQQSIARIHEACQAPALAPAEYRLLFDVMADEISRNGLQGTQTLVSITQRAREFGLDIKRDDLRFILEVVSESDPWFEQGASANLFSGRFRNFVVARCRSQGINLSADELDLVDAWFSSQPQQAQAASHGRQPAAASLSPAAPSAAQAQAPAQGERWWSLEEGRAHIAEQRSQGGYGAPETEDEFPRIVRRGLRG